jgi:2-polyprenyl-3-methyl-5-hydroxy-6-metoxy-1,4-benzoquinol methylase
MKTEHDQIASVKRKEDYSKKWFIKALELLKQEKIEPKNVIDIGAGKGELLKILRDNFNNVNTVGIDYTEANLEALKQKGIQAIKVDLDNFNIEDYLNLKNKFDLVVCLEVIEHIFNTDRLFKFFHLLLKEGSYFLISAPNVGSFHFRLFYLLRGYPFGENHHVRFFNKNKLQQYAFFNGLDLIKWDNYHTFHPDIIKRGFGVRNKFIVNFLALLFFGPLLIFRKFNLIDSLVNDGFVALFKKSHFASLGMELDNCKSNFEKLSDRERQLWLDRIREYYKRDKLREHIYFKSYIEEIIRKE